MTQDEAIALAVAYTTAHNLNTELAEISAVFRPMDALYRAWNTPTDTWFVFFTFPHLDGIDSNFYTIAVNAITEEVFHEPHL